MFMLARREWRTREGHLIKNVDPISGVPLAVRVCMDHGGLAYNSQADDFSSIQQYRTWGPILAALCSFMWLVKVINEIGSSLRVTIAIARLRGAKTKIVQGKLGSVSTPRIVWFTFVQMTRLTVAVILAVYGTIFLTHTIELSEVILNCVALTFVMEVHSCFRACLQARIRTYA